MHVSILLGDGFIFLLVEQLDLGTGQSVALGVGRNDFEALHAERGNPEQAVGAMFPVDDGCRGADRVNIGADQGLLSLVNQHHAETAVFTHAAGNHVEVARFENFQVQLVTREKNGFEGEKRNFGHNGLVLVYSCAHRGEMSLSISS